MFLKCHECGEQKKGCRIINKVIPDYWHHIYGKMISRKDWLGKPVCRRCLNFTRKFKIWYMESQTSTEIKYDIYYDVI